MVKKLTENFRKWAPCQKGNRPKSVYAWIKRTEMLVRGESLTWGHREAPINVEDRAEHAITEYTQQQGVQLPLITGNRVRKVLQHMSAQKAKGMDHWGPDEQETSGALHQ